MISIFFISLLSIYMKRIQSLVHHLFLAILFSGCVKKKVSLIVVNANIYKVDSNYSQASAMAVHDGKIVAMGNNVTIQTKYQSANNIDAKGATILPGFIDAHAHFTGYATDMWKCDLVGTKSYAEILTKLKAYSTNIPTQWLYGRGWNENDWIVKTYPTKKMLDSLYPNRPVFLKRIDGRTALLNQMALSLAGVQLSTSVPGGVIGIKNGQLTGILTDKAMDMAEQAIPTISDSMAMQYYLAAQANCFAVGLTSIHDCDISESTIQLLKTAQQNLGLRIKIFALLADSAQYYNRWIKSGPLKTANLTVGGFKLYADGALGNRGACLLNSYTDKKDWYGQMLAPEAHYKAVAEALMNTKLQLNIQAIGDSANRTILKIYANVLKGKNDKRWRITHAQVVQPKDVHYFAAYNIIPSVMPTHATSDMYWAVDRLGKKRINHAYTYQQLLQTNGWLPLGTDFPVEDMNPIKTFFAAVVRQNDKGLPRSGFNMDNALTRKQALYGITIWAAKAAYEEGEKGSLEVGKAADFVMLDTDIMNCPTNQILATKVISTWLNGIKVWGK